MVNGSLSMEFIKQIELLSGLGYGKKTIAKELSLSKNTVKSCLSKGEETLRGRRTQQQKGTSRGLCRDLMGTLWEYSPRKLLWISQVCGRDVLSRQMQNAQKDLKTVTMVPPMSLLLFLDIHIKLIRLHKIKQVWEGFNREY